ncbi:GatB/YqeY domain-containing protein [Corynebacterium timonense]|uniref:GatB/YqeY domain-containing protein n=1 Tax=Corynebacterium timonense TaxID=441500 RepID=A0A1H1TLS4_9CORY|nr:GatB/YqeY domain-containing protein [Corynebacterium timonense]SDS61122.1 hypothetical protein SAMN04488539_2019 [Corynebacterium timonense]
MSDLKDTIRADLKEAMKAKEKERTGTLRMLLAAIQTAETEGSKHEVDDEEIQKIIAREIKKRRESADIYSTNGREDLAETERTEADILEAYRPKQLTDEELSSLIDATLADLGASDMSQMGAVMKEATARAAGRADGKRLSAAVRARLG